MTEQPEAGMIVRDILFNPYKHRSSIIHRLHSPLKLIVAVALIFLIVLLPRNAWPSYAIVAVFLIIIGGLSRISPLELGKRLLLLEPFAIGIALLSMLQANGFQIFLALLTKSTLCLFCMILVAATTRFTDILSALRRLHVPALLVTILALMYRYLFLLLDEMGRMQRARKSRTYVRSRWFTWRLSATVIALLFVRTSERAERIFSAMRARGWKT